LSSRPEDPARCQRDVDAFEDEPHGARDQGDCLVSEIQSDDVRRSRPLQRALMRRVLGTLVRARLRRFALVLDRPYNDPLRAADEAAQYVELAFVNSSGVLHPRTLGVGPIPRHNSTR
jgi:hypothetical protein